MRVNYYSLYIIGTMCVPLAHTYQLSPVENELRDLVTQTSVIRRAGMVEVIQNFRDGNILTVEWPRLIDTAIQLDKASELLTWYIETLEQMSIHESTYFPPLGP